MGRLLIIDDDEASCRLVGAVFRGEGHAVVAAHDGSAGLARAASIQPDVVILDLHLPEIDGLDVLARLQTTAPALPVILLTAHADVKTAVRATQLGAFDYITKPFDPDELLLVVRRAFETRALKDEVEALRKQVGGESGLDAAMGPSDRVVRVVEQVRTVAASDFTVLVLGETGTGKELVAHAIHRTSARRARPFVALDCGAIPEPLLESELFGHEKGAFTGADRRRTGQFTMADGGTLFLDEIGNLPLALQAKLLRVLESRQVVPVGGTATATDVRFVAATNDDLQARVTAGRFRADLYFRLAQYTISLPPLRERPADIPHLARRFLDEASVELRRPVREIAADAIVALERHAWPGNVRELRNVIRQAVLESRLLVIERAAIVRLLGKPGTTTIAPTAAGERSLRQIADDAAREAERHAISDALRATRGNKSKAARLLDTDYKTLHVKMKNLGIRARDFTA
jgi:DNA-binding NtrC family response regulator